jgi:hypothetical protein
VITTQVNYYIACYPYACCIHTIVLHLSIEIDQIEHLLYIVKKIGDIDNTLTYCFSVRVECEPALCTQLFAPTIAVL